MLKLSFSYKTQNLFTSPPRLTGVFQSDERTRAPHRPLMFVSALALSLALPACGDDDAVRLPDASMGADSGGGRDASRPSRPGPDSGPSGFQGGTFNVVSPVWSENDCGADQSIESTYTFNSIGAGEFEVAEAPGLVLTPDGDGGFDGELELTRDLRPEQECSLEIRIRMTMEPRGDGNFESEQRIRLDETPLGANADCEEATMELFGLSEWNSLAGCEWRVAYMLQR